MAGTRALTPDEAKDLRRLIKFKVRKFQRAAGKSADADDLEQELACRVLERLPKFDAARASLPTFCSRVVDRILVDLERQRHAQKRNSGSPPLSLNAPVGGNADAGQLWQTIADENCHFTGTGGSSVTGDQIDLRNDLAETLASMTPEQRSVCEGIMYLSVTETAQELGVSRGTAYRHWQNITNEYQDHSLKEYLP